MKIPNADRATVWQVDTATDVPRFIPMYRGSMPFKMYGDAILTRDVTESALRLPTPTDRPAVRVLIARAA